MIMGSKHLRRYCKECGNLTTIQRKVVTNPFNIQLVISIVIIIILGLVKSHI